jgi:hypothetical protein
VVAVAQVPPPVQETAGVKTLVVALQLAVPQPTLLAACVQTPEPSQAPVLPQTVLPLQRPWGSVSPPVTLAQVPRPFMLQAWQVLQALVEQQTPSTQEAPPAHSWLVPQAVPSDFWATQVPFEAAVQ